MLRNFKIKKVLKHFKEFKQTFNFEFKNIQIIDGKQFCDDILLLKENGENLAICDKWVDVGFKYHGPLSKALSNLFPYTFIFKNKKVHSIESVFQAIKIKDKSCQNLALKYYGIPSNTIKICSDFDWKKDHIIYWQGKPIKRDSKEYEDFIDELYISALQNKLYMNALKNVSVPYILHSMGTENKEETVFTRYEFEFMLNALKEFVKFIKE